MRTDILIALIAAGASIFAAAVAWLQALRTARLRADTELQIENSKASADRRKRAYEAARSDAAPLEAALDQAWISIQRLKESLSAIMTIEGSTTTVVGEVLDAAQSLTDGYTRNGAALTDVSRKAWHRAKSVAVGVAGYLSEAKRADTLTKDLGDKKKHLTDARQALSEAQSDIAAERAAVRYQLAQRLTELI